MLSDTISGSVFMLALTMAWRDLPDEKKDRTDPLKMWDSMTPATREMFLASARRFRDALIEVEDAIDPRAGDTGELHDRLGNGAGTR